MHATTLIILLKLHLPAMGWKQLLNTLQRFLELLTSACSIGDHTFLPDMALQEFQVQTLPKNYH